MLHHQVIDPFLMANVVQGADVRMAQAGDGLCFALETLAQLRIAGQMFGKNLDGNSAIKPRISGTIHLPMQPAKGHVGV